MDVVMPERGGGELGGVIRFADGVLAGSRLEPVHAAYVRIISMYHAEHKPKMRHRVSTVVQLEGKAKINCLIGVRIPKPAACKRTRRAVIAHTGLSHKQ